MGAKIAETLSTPVQVVESLSDVQARLYYRFYLIDKVKKGRQLWPREK